MATKESCDSGTFKRIVTLEKDSMVPDCANGILASTAAYENWSRRSTSIPNSDSKSNSDDDTNYEDTDYEDEDNDGEGNQFLHVHQISSSRLEESDTIVVLGSLCDQGIFQGMLQGSPKAKGKKFLPESIRMTSALEKVSHELDALSVMVTKNLELVAENSPFGRKDQKKRMHFIFTNYCVRFVYRFSQSASKHQIAINEITCNHGYIY